MRISYKGAGQRTAGDGMRPGAAPDGLGGKLTRRAALRRISKAALLSYAAGKIPLARAQTGGIVIDNAGRGRGVGYNLSSDPATYKLRGTAGITSTLTQLTAQQFYAETGELPRHGNKVLKFTHSVADAAAGRQVFIQFPSFAAAPIDMSNFKMCGLWVYCRDDFHHGFSSLGLQGQFCSKSFANYMIPSRAGTSARFRPGMWSFLGFTPFDTAAIGSETWASAKIAVQWRSFAKTTMTQPMVIYIDSLIMDFLGRPQLVVTVDDGHVSNYDPIFTYMASKGLVGTACIDPRLMGVSGKMSVAQTQALYDGGWDIVHHASPFFVSQYEAGTKSCLDDSGVAHFNLDAVRQQIKNNLSTTVTSHPRATMLGKGWTRGISFGAYPGGETDAAIVDLLTSEFDMKAWRGTLDGLCYTADGVDRPMVLDCYAVRNDTAYGALPNDAAGIAALDRTIAAGATMFLTVHQVVDAANSWTGYPLGYFQSIMDYAAYRRDLGDLDVLTMSQWYAALPSV